jgi:dipeptidyl aminopeptidase/acylaminoacyl peptidase
VWVLLFIPVLAEAASAQLTPEQAAAIEQVGSAVISPDGRWVAYTLIKPRAPTATSGAAWSELWVIPARGGTARAVVQAPQSASGAAWSPDGRWLTYVARPPSATQSQVFAVPVEGGEARALTSSPTGVIAYAWSPDGARIAYTSTEPEPAGAAERRSRGDDVVVMSQRLRHVRLWVETIAGANRTALTQGDRTAHDFAWAPDGTRLAVQVTETPEVDADYMFRRIYTVPAGGGPLTLLTETRGKLATLAWSPDGGRVAFVGAVSFDDPLAQSVFVAAPGGIAVNRTPDYEGSVLTLNWLDARTIAFVAAEGTKTVLNRLDAERGAPERIAGGGAEVFTGLSLDAGRSAFAAAASTAEHPAEVFVGSLRDGALQRRTTHNPWLAQVRLGRQETVAWTGADGLRIEGVYVHPLDAPAGGGVPLAILPHGGPEGISYDNWSTNPLYPAQVLAASGYAVLMPNYRGSGGRGVAFSKADHRDLGGEEFEDVLLGIDALAARGLVDPDRVGISGTSYGGYFSALAGTRYSHRFRLAIPFAGITNWVSFTGTTDIPVEMSEVHWDLWWWDHPGLAMDRSPVAHLGNARTPMLIGHGMADERVHPEQSIQLYQGLKLKGVPVELVLYPREPHGLRESAHQLDYMKRIVEWFDRYVKAPKVTTD